MQARYPGTCPNCGDKIAKGQEISFDNRRAVHADCVNVPTIEEATTREVVKTIRVWSSYQQAVFDAVRTSARSIMVRAVAGSGKTSVIEEIVNIVATDFPQLSTIAVAFNTKIVDELKLRLPKTATVGTFHSVWNNALAAYLGRRPSINGNKVRSIAREWAKSGKLDSVVASLYLTGAVKLVAAAKSAGVGVCIDDVKEVWSDLIDRFEITFDGTDPEIGIELAKLLLAADVDDTSTIDFDDMLYLPALFGAGCTQYDIVLVDEAQDFNPVQRTLLHRMLAPNGRLVAVGDPNQSIYAFRGAAYDSMDQIREEFDCIEMPLSVSYRCPQAVIKLAQSIVPDIEPHESAPMGKVTTAGPFNVQTFTTTDMVICRNTAPLVTLAYRCFAAHVPCRMLGREIGEGMISLVKQMKATDIEELQEKLQSYRQQEVSRLIRREQEEKAQALEDKCETIFAAIAGITGERTIEGLIATIQDVFAPKPEGMLTLSTVHKAKGAEAPRVFILNPHLMPSRYARKPEQQQQERNILYVAYTRAKEELVFLDLIDVH